MKENIGTATQWECGEERVRPLLKRQRRGLSERAEWLRNRSSTLFDFGVQNIEENLERKVSLVNTLKKEVKLLMEESVNRRQININCNYVAALCAVIEECLLDRLKRKMLGLFGIRSTYALLYSISKFCPDAAVVIAKISEQQADERLRCRRYYGKDALILDPVRGSMVATLLVGPCAIEYAIMYDDNQWAEPSADEILQRHRLHASTSLVAGSSSRPPLSVLKSGSSIISSTDSYSSGVTSLGRDYIYSLHQNFKYSLLYGKNNVVVTLASNFEEIKGYLSLHQNSPGNVTVKWIPNQLMHSSIGDSSPATVIFIGTDGVQHPPMQFPIGQHLLGFLTSLESCLMPYNRLDPPLWISKDKGKILPKLRRRSVNSQSVNQPEERYLFDYVFRIVSVSKNVMRDLEIEKNAHATADPDKSLSDVIIDELTAENETRNPAVEWLTLNMACVSMKHQILARAFLGWKSYSCHMKTIRAHLSGLIDNEKIAVWQSIEPVDEAFWFKYRKTKSTELRKELLIRIYCNGIEETNSNGLRKEIWPYLFGACDWSEDINSRLKLIRIKYNEDVEKWGKVEVKVRERDTELLAAARLRYSSSNCDAGSEYNAELSSRNDLQLSDLKPEEALILDFGANLHRVMKDVDRCDRTSSFFASNDHLAMLKRLMCTYVWRNLDEGYVQGMCDIAAPLLVVFNDEALALTCFTRLMMKLHRNFPQNPGMDENLASMQSLLHVMDPELYDLMTKNGEFSNFYFCYRWFLLDFKREFTYQQVFKIWEVMWAASSLISRKFHLFIALSLVRKYRRILIDNRMDFTDVIKFFNEMAEHHDHNEILNDARCLLDDLQKIIRELHEKTNK